MSPQGGYVPPSVRNRGAAGMGDSMHRREENSVRVTNLSEDTREEDLRVSPGNLNPKEEILYKPQKPQN